MQNSYHCEGEALLIEYNKFPLQNMFGARRNQLSKPLVMRSRFTAFSSPSYNVTIVTSHRYRAVCPGCDVTIQSSLRSCVWLTFGGAWGSKKGLEKLHFTPFHDIYMISQQIIRVFQEKIFPSICNLF